MSWESDTPEPTVNGGPALEVSKPPQIIKEGFLEKKGHATAFLLWPK